MISVDTAQNTSIKKLLPKNSKNPMYMGIAIMCFLFLLASGSLILEYNGYL